MSNQVIWNQLLAAESSLEFWVLMCAALQQRQGDSPKIRTLREGNEMLIKVIVEQHVPVISEIDGKEWFGFSFEETHSFFLSQSGRLWWQLGEDTRIDGLEAIQNELRRKRDEASPSELGLFENGS